MSFAHGKCWPAILVGVALVATACGSGGEPDAASNPNGSPSSTTSTTTTVAASNDTTTTVAASNDATTTVAVEPADKEPIAPGGYPFEDSIDIAQFDLYSQINSIGGDCSRVRQVLVSEQAGVETDEVSCGEQGATNLYALELLDEFERVHEQRVEINPDTSAPEPYVASETIWNFDSAKPTRFERSRAVQTTVFPELDEAWTATPIDDPAASAAEIRARLDDGQPDHYICYSEDNAAAPDLMVAFDESGIALWVRYDGQVATIPVDVFSQEVVGSSLVDMYDEIVTSGTGGVYKLTHSGNWDYAGYERPDGTIFDYTIDFDRSVSGGGGYTDAVCL